MRLIVITIILFNLAGACITNPDKSVSLVVSDSISLTDTVKAPDDFIIDTTYGHSNDTVYMFCENMPEFPGGQDAFESYLRKTIRYPKSAANEGYEGRVIARFVISSEGKPEEVSIKRSVRKDMDDECIRALSGMPSWKSGTINGKPVAVSFGVSIRFLHKRKDNLNGIYILP
ncbi:MAG TPA: energy transducer TonB [Bacteroidales bacterium]|nr:energy transducer TonB [Bacteroidales bacterium]